MQVDVAVTIDKPDLQQEEELSAHLFRNVEVWQGVCIALSQSSQSGRSSVQADTIRAKHFDSTDVATGFAGWTRGAFEGWYTSRLQAVVAA